MFSPLAVAAIKREFQADLMSTFVTETHLDFVADLDLDDAELLCLPFLR